MISFDTSVAEEYSKEAVAFYRVIPQNIILLIQTMQCNSVLAFIPDFPIKFFFNSPFDRTINFFISK